MRSLVVAIACVACWTDPPSPEPPRPEPPRTRALPRTPPCASDPATDADVHLLYNCATAALDARDYATADRLAEQVLAHFQYSRFAPLAELVRGDILAAEHDWEGAVRTYDDWLRAHPRHEDRARVMAKRDAAAAHMPVN